jgi:hypothetical protein
MRTFIQRHKEDVIGVLSGLDRIRFRGTLRSISYGDGVESFLCAHHVQYRHFGAYAESLSERIKQHAERLACRLGRPYRYVASSAESKEEIALEIARRDDIQEGLVCVLRCVEPCKSFRIRPDSQGQFRFVSEERKCLHLYFYYMDPEFGLIHVRLATWLPFGLQVCLNGREHLARRMRKAGIGFEQRDNCFAWIEDVPRAQRMMRELEGRKWDRLLSALARRVNPLVDGRSGLDLRGYYWSVQESEYATDVMFRDAAALKRLYPALVAHAMRHFSCRDVLRFLGRRTLALRFTGEVNTSCLERSDGVRVKHRAEENSIKMYDKQGSVLRIETTINNARRFKVRRMTTWKGVRGMRWIPMRHGVADLVRRMEVSCAANERYMEALAVVGVPLPVKDVLDVVSQRVVKEQRPYRALRPIHPEEAKLFEAVLDGQFLIKGFTNRELRQRVLGPSPSDAKEAKRSSGRMTRLLRLLRAHGLIRKVSHTRYYRVTEAGHRIMSASLALRGADIARLAA